MRGRSRVAVKVAFGVAVGVGVAVEVGAGCSSSHALACPAEPLACPSLDGLTTFCTWAEWGCTSESACGGYYAVVDPAVDAEYTYYYSAQTGAYVATLRADYGGDSTCFNGPASFTPPASCSYATTAECAPPARDGGIGPIDASVDAADTGVVIGSPSSQPLARPPPAR
jgi:hypothetical protein